MEGDNLRAMIRLGVEVLADVFQPRRLFNRDLAMAMICFILYGILTMVGISDLAWTRGQILGTMIGYCLIRYIIRLLMLMTHIALPSVMLWISLVVREGYLYAVLLFFLEWFIFKVVYRGVFPLISKYSDKNEFF